MAQFICLVLGAAFGAMVMYILIDMGVVKTSVRK